MYETLLFIHSWVRWLALAGVVIVFLREVRASTTGQPWLPSDLTWMKGAAHLLGAQVAIGLLLYATSPYIRALLGNIKSAMQDHSSRFLLVEHGVTMVLAVAATHMGAAIARKGATDKAKHARAAVFFGVAVLLMAYAIPWSRPLFRLGQ